MLLNPEDFELSRFKQNRSDSEEYGDSGPLYFGISKDSSLPSVIIKQFYVMHAANEYIGCTLGKLLGVHTPQAWLFKKHNQIKRCSFRHSVGIEYLDGLASVSKQILYDDAHIDQTLRACMLHCFLDEEDGDSAGILNDQIYAYDFSETFCLGNMGDGFIKILKNRNDYSSAAFAARAQAQYLNSVSSAIEQIALWSKYMPVSKEAVKKVFMEMRGRYIDLYQNHELDSVLAEIAKLYPTQVADYYGGLFEILANVLTGIRSSV